MIEVEQYRRAASRAVGRRIAAVHAPDAWFLKRGLDAAAAGDALVGRTLHAARRIGKLLLLDTDGPTVGVRFGMTGRLLLDGAAAIERLEYGSSRDLSAWDRFVLHLDDGGDLRVRDPRRLGGIELEPDESRLGVDAGSVMPSELAAALASSVAPLKARLLDQSHIAGLGNLMVDEILWRASLDPARPAGALAPRELRRLHRHVRSTVDDMLARGGAHTGRLQEARVRGATCPRDGAPLLRRTVGGRTTYSCPLHQR
ncbi:MAG: DNA-formamidopyrimidine glycosylase family protein [Acidimicrobiales bacterium]